MNNTIRYYNENADNYYDATIDVDFTDTYDRFLKYIPEHGSIIDIGCGSGRDAVAFALRGYQVVGLDASEKLAVIAEKEAGIPIIVADMSSWKADEPFDGIWCCASLLHLQNNKLCNFFENLRFNLKQSGAIFISVKSGIETGIDNKGRYMRNFTKSELTDLLKNTDIQIVEQWESRDKLSRSDFYWINIIGVKEQENS